jgi:hypothetical protein
MGVNQAAHARVEPFYVADALLAHLLYGREVVD